MTAPASPFKDGISASRQPIFTGPATSATAKVASVPASSITELPASRISISKRCNRFKYGKRYQCYYPGCTFSRTTLEELQRHFSPKATAHPGTLWDRTKAIEIYVEDPKSAISKSQPTNLANSESHDSKQKEAAAPKDRTVNLDNMTMFPRLKPPELVATSTPTTSGNDDVEFHTTNSARILRSARVQSAVKGVSPASKLQRETNWVPSAISTKVKPLKTFRSNKVTEPSSSVIHPPKDLVDSTLGNGPQGKVPQSGVFKTALPQSVPSVIKRRRETVEEGKEEEVVSPNFFVDGRSSKRKRIAKPHQEVLTKGSDLVTPTVPMIDAWNGMPLQPPNFRTAITQEKPVHGTSKGSSPHLGNSGQARAPETIRAEPRISNSSVALPLDEYVAKVNRWALDKDPSASWLTRARESFLVRIDNTIKEKAEEEYGGTDVNGVAFYAGSMMLDELNELADGQYRDLKIAGYTIASLEQLLDESEKKKRSVEALMEKQEKMTKSLQTKEGMLTEALTDVKATSDRRGLTQAILRRKLKADCEEKAILISELNAASQRKENRILQLGDTAQSLLKRVSVLEESNRENYADD